MDRRAISYPISATRFVRSCPRVLSSSIPIANDFNSVVSVLGVRPIERIIVSLLRVSEHVARYFVRGSEETDSTRSNESTTGTGSITRAFNIVENCIASIFSRETTKKTTILNIARWNNTPSLGFGSWFFDRFEDEGRASGYRDKITKGRGFSLRLIII